MDNARALKLEEENARLASDVVFLTKQVSNRDKIIQELEEIAKLGIDESSYVINKEGV